jgi:hypothetical protein
MNQALLFSRTRERSGSPNTSILAKEQTHLTEVLAGAQQAIYKLDQLRELKRYAVLHRGSGRLKAMPIPVAPEPPWEEFQPATLTNLDRFLTGITAPVLLTPLQRLFGSRAPVVSTYTPASFVPGAFHTLRITRSQDAPVTLANTVQLFLSLVPSLGVVSWELVGTHKQLICQLACDARYTSHLTGQLLAHYPTFSVEEAEDALAPCADLMAHHYALSAATVFPLTLALPAGPDPLNSLVGVLETLSAEDTAGLQLLMIPCQSPWVDTLLQACRDDLSGEPILTEPNLVTLAAQKTKAPLFAVVIRSFFSHPLLGERLAAYFALFQSKYTSLVPAAAVPFAQIKARVTTRYGVLLNAEELAHLCHFPSILTFAEKLPYAQKSHPAPAIVTHQDGIIIGENYHRGVRHRVRLTDEQRTRHVYIIGVSGTGKTTLLVNMILRDIERGAGVCVLDPHGDLVEHHILPRIPDHRAPDLIYFDPTNEAHAIPFNMLYAHSDDERDLLTEDLVAIFRRFSTGWGSQLEGVLAHAIMAMLASPLGGHLQDLRDFLLDPHVRTRYLATITDTELRHYWEQEFPLLPRAAVTPVLTRLSSFLRRKRIRAVVCQKESRLDFRQIMDTGKILLVKCAVGALGEDNAYLLGALLVAKLQQTVMTRQAIDEHLRRPFFLYLDEFQSFITPSMEAILSGARKYQLGVTLAHQELQQLWSRSREVAASVLSNPYTRICFGVGDRDARLLAEGLVHFDASDLQRLSRGQAIVRVERADCDFNLTTLPPPAVPAEDERAARVGALLALSRTTYGSAMSREEYARDDSATTESQELVPDDTMEETAGTPATAPAPSQEPLLPDEQDFLHFVGTLEELLPVREVYKRLKVSADKGTRLKAQLIEAGLMIEVEVPLHSRGRNSKLLVLTSQGLDAVHLPMRAGKGGALHQQLQRVIATYAEHQGWSATVEAVGTNNKAVDIGLEKEGRRIAVELCITTRAPHELQNILEDLRGGYERVVTLCVAPDAVDAIQRLIAEQDAAAAAYAHCGLVKDFVSLLLGITQQDTGKAGD